MYVNPFWFGVMSTILAEIAAFFILVFYCVAKSK